MTFHKIFLIVYLTIISACALVSNASNEDIIAKNASARWQALIENNWQDAYQFETKGYQDSHSVEQFKAGFGRSVAWKNVKIDKIEIDPVKKKATVFISLVFTAVIPGFGEQDSVSNLTETWLFSDGDWRHYGN